MGRPEIVETTADIRERGIHIGLPLKITGIVFWGLVAIGLVLAAETMHWLHSDMAANQSASARQTELMIRTLFTHKTAFGPDELQQCRKGSHASLSPHAR